MLLRSDAEPNRVGILGIDGDICRVNAMMNSLCASDSGNSHYPISQMRELGQEVTAVYGKMTLGAWLVDLALQNADSVQFARCTAVDLTVIDAVVEKGIVRVVCNDRAHREQHARHQLRNRVNGIKMNGELAKMLAIKGNLERLQRAAETIITQCDGLILDDPPGEAGELELDAGLADSPVETLRRLHGGKERDSRDGSWSIQISSTCPRDLFLYISHTLAMLSNAAGPGIGSAIEPGSGLSVIQCSGTTGVAEFTTIFQLLQGAGIDAFVRTPTSTYHLSPSVQAYEVECKADHFQMSFRERRATLTL